MMNVFCLKPMQILFLDAQRDSVLDFSKYIFIENQVLD